MTALAFILGIALAFYAGYKYERLLSSLRSLRELLDKKQDVKEVTHTSNTSNNVIDALDPVQVARFEHDILMKKLNPED